MPDSLKPEDYLALAAKLKINAIHSRLDDITVNVQKYRQEVKDQGLYTRLLILIMAALMLGSTLIVLPMMLEHYIKK